MSSILGESPRGVAEKRGDSGGKGRGSWSSSLLVFMDRATPGRELLPLLPGSGLGRGPQMWLRLRGGAGSLEGGRLAATAAALITFSPDLISH